MADEKKTLPFMSAKNWFALRKQFSRTVPPLVTNSYVASILNMGEDSARANVVAALKITGLIDKDNKPTQLAYRWRDDEQYPEVCEEIRQAVYPEELKAIAPDTHTPQDRVEKWLANKLQVGESSAKKLASFYMLLVDADPTKETEVAGRPVGGRRTRIKSIVPQTAPQNTEVSQTELEKPAIAVSSPIDENVIAPTMRKHHPSLHIDIQIHISPEASADQIDQIFESMAKHLKL